MELNENNNSPKYAFYYLLSLFALGFMAVSTGTIIFQIINKNVVDLLASSMTCYEPGALRSAIAAIIISTPIYYVSSFQINKNLYLGKLKLESGVRKWLTYFILFVSFAAITGYLISIIYNFLDGELTVKFILKTVTALIIAAAVFSYYLYEIKRAYAVGKKDNALKIYFYASLFAVILSLISGIVFVESPVYARAKKQDDKIVENLDIIKMKIDAYTSEKGIAPKDFDELLKNDLLVQDNILNPFNKKEIEYKIEKDAGYKLCAEFLTSNLGKEGKDCSIGWYNDQWPHDKGYQCFEKDFIFNY